MATAEEHELQALTRDEDESNERQQDASSGQKDGCETQEEQHIEIKRTEGEESDDLSNEHSVAVRGEPRGRRWFSSCLRCFRCDAQKTDGGNDDSSDSETAISQEARNWIGVIRHGLSEDVKNLLPEARSKEDPVLMKAIARPLEERLMEVIGEGKYENIEKLLSPRVFEHCESNSLLLSMKVSYKLHKLADEKGPDAERFKQLANSLEEFTYHFLDPIESPLWVRIYRQDELLSYAIDHILDAAIGYDQKKFFTHPVVHNEMNCKWNGRGLMKSKWKSWQLITFFHMWCLFDLVLSPILFAVFSLLRNKEKENQSVAWLYLCYLESPYYKFVRDTLSYIILLFLHYALCLSPSTIAFSGLELSILVFFIGRYLVESKQIWGVRKWLRQSKETKNDGAPLRCLEIFSRYLSDSWNKLDFVSLVIYLIVLTLRIVTWVIGGSVTNNRALVIAGYLYSFNTFCLTLRAFGHVMEQSKEVGTIQIALFTILKDIRAIVWQFMAVIVAFSMAITKIYMSEKSFVASGSDRHETACKESGFSCWWAITLHLCWSLLDQSGESDPMASVDLTSVTLARILFAAFLILGVILLVNMLIALLSNTYQKTEENSIREWSFKRAVTIHTYDGYDPIPVPLNIIYSIFIILRKLFKKDDRTHCDCENRCIDESHCECFVSSLKCHDLCACNQGYCNNVFTHIDILEELGEDYFKTHEDIFPIADDTEVKVDDIQKNVKDVQTKVEDIQIRVKDIEHSRQIMSGIHITTFLSQFGDQGKLCSSQTAWHSHPGIRIEGPLLTFKCSIPEEDVRGARYRNRFSPEFPHFEVIIIETGERRFLGIGIVDEGYNTKEMPGWYKESIGYHTDDGKIFPNQGFGGKKTEGPTADSGDRIRCTVMFEEKRERDGKVQVPVFFTLNGKKMIVKKRDEDEEKDENERSHFYMDWDLYYKPLFPYICMTFGGIVLAKMCAKEDDEHHSPELQEKKADPADDAHSERGALKENSPQLEEIKADLVDVGKQLIYAREDVVRQSLHIQDVKSDLAAVREDMCSKEDVSREVKKATRCLEEKLDALLARLGEKE